ncbi:MAG TPA: WG repeat-containing protein, partial [Thermoanaerobaculia bacterium]|nr:WG repeat-containing protein [Thermoanaerobaculia bacterium]
SGSKWGFIDDTGKFVINPQFDRAGNFSEGLASVLIGDRAGFVDREGKLVINPQYDAMSSFSGGLALVVSEGRWAYIDKTGKPVWTMPEPKQAEGSQSGEPMLASGSGAMGMGDDASRQRQTVADIRNVGTAMFSWLTDQVGSAAAGDTVNLMSYPRISNADLVRILVPQYIQEIPTHDGWGNLYEYHLNTGNPMAPQVMSIRSPGRGGAFSASHYTVGAFIPSNYDEDIVWADGYFVRWPQKQE